MSPKTLTDSVTRRIGRQALILKKNSPVLMFGTGVVGIITAGVLACRATLRLEETLEQGIEDLSIVEDAEKKSPEFAEEGGNKARAFVQLRTAGRVAKLYAPAITIGALSLACLTGSHVALTKRNTGLMAAYAGAMKAFDEYRSRVVKEYGEEKDRDLRYGIVDREIVEEDENGPVVRTIKGTDPNGKPSMYGRVFAKHTSSVWSPDPGANQTILMVQQNYANQKLQARGHVFLNEIYDALGLKRTAAGAVCGWIRGEGDNEISFGFFDNLRAGTEFVNGDRNSIWLDFNVDGVIYDKIKETEDEDEVA